jgi:hypothetical protein
MLIWLLPVLVVLIGGAIAAIPIYFAVRFHRRGAAVANMEATMVDKLKPGPAKIKARVRAREELLVSPMGRHPCVYYRFQVRELRQTGGGPHGGGYTWYTVVDDSRSIDLILEDDTGKAGIDLRDAEVVLKTGKTVNSGTFNDPPESLRQLLQRRYGRSTKGLLFNKRMSYVETILPDEAKVIVVGEVEPNSKGVPVFRKGDVPLLVGDREDDQLRTPYGRKAVYCWIGAGFVLFGTALFTVGAVMFALFFSVGASMVEKASTMKAAMPAPPVEVVPAPGDFKGPPRIEIPDKGNPVVPPAQREPDLDQLLIDLRSPDQFKRKAAADKIGQTPVVEARRAEVQQALEPLLQEDQPFTTGAALKALQTWGDKNIVPTLVQMLQKGGNRLLRRQVMETLAKFPDERGADAVAETLANLADRNAAGKALRAMGPVAEQSVLRQLQASRDSMATREACAVLADIGSPASLPTLDKLGAEKSAGVAAAARKAADSIRKRNPGN